MRDDEEEAVESDEFELTVGAARIVDVAEGRRSGRGGGIGDGEGDRRSNAGVGVDKFGVKNTVEVGEGVGDGVGGFDMKDAVGEGVA